MTEQGNQKMVFKSFPTSEKYIALMRFEFQKMFMIGFFLKIMPFRENRITMQFFYSAGISSRFLN